MPIKKKSETGSKNAKPKKPETKKRVASAKSAKGTTAESSEKYRALFDSAPIGIAILDLEGYITDINPAVTAISGYPEKYFLKKHFSGLPWFGGKNQPQYSSLFTRLLKGKGIPPIPLTGQTADGNTRHIELSSRLVKPNGAQPFVQIIVRDVTESKQAEEALWESEKRYKQLLNSVTDYIYTVQIENGQPVSTTHGPGCFTVTGYTPEDYKANPELWHQMIHKEDLPMVVTHLNKMLAGGDIPPIEHRIFHQDGSTRWVRVTYVPRYDNQHRMISYDGLIQDITERKQVEHALRESEEQYRFLSSNISDFIARYNQNGVLVFGTNASYGFHGYELSEIINTSAFERIHPEDWQKTRDELKHVIETGLEGRVEYRLKRKDGEYMWVEAVGKRAYDSAGKPEVIIVQRNITGRKKAEEALKESETRAQAMLRAIPDMMFRMNRQGVFIDYKADIHDLYAQSDSTIIGKRNRDIAPPEFADLIDSKIHKSLETGELQTFEYQLPIPNKGMRTYEARMIASGKEEVTAIVRDITERKQAESQKEAALEKLRESEERYRIISENVADVIWVLDPAAGRFTYVSPSVEKLRGYTPDEVLSQPVNESLTPESLKRVEEMFAVRIPQFLSLNSEKMSFLDEVDQPCRDGSIVNTEVKTTYLQNERGDLEIIGITRDITERKQAEEALRAASSYNRRLIEASIDPLVVIGPDGKITDVNEATETVTGVLRKQLIGDDFSNYFTEPEKAKEGYQKVLAEGFVRNYPLTIRQPSGKTTDVLYNATVYKNKAGEIEGIFAAARDISESKRAEQALYEQQQVFRTLVENSPDIIARYDRDCRRIYVNPAYLKTAQIPLQELLTTSPIQVSPLPTTSARILQNLIRKVLDSGVAEAIDVIWPKADNNDYWYNIYASPEFDREGQVVSVITVSRDITERKQAEEEIRKLNATLEQRVEERTRELRNAQEQLVRQEKLAVLGQLAGSVGHELRNPLGVIANSVYFLRMAQPDASEKVREYLDLIEKHVHISDMIIADLLDFTRVKSVDREPIAIDQLIQQTLERFPPPDFVEVKLDLPDNLSQAYADPQHIIQVLGNFTLNACQAMSKQGGTLAISAHAQDGMIGISVRDTGTGISPENMKKLFEPLFTTKPKGIGLGLAVSKKLIEANSGRIEVQSEAGKGSTFTVYLPVKAEGAPP